MKIVKRNYKLIACFTAKELVQLLLKEDFNDLMNIALNHTLAEAQVKVNALALKQNKLRDSSELWTAIFGLYQEFDESCEICFLLNSKFNHNKNKLDTVQKLIEYKEDPPDLIILENGKFYDFELKRYFDKLNINSLLLFIKDKLLNYSDAYNFYILLQPKESELLDLSLFEKLQKELSKMNLKKSLGIISFSFNEDNKYIINIQVYPDFKLSKSKWLSGTEQVASILNK